MWLTWVRWSYGDSNPDLLHAWQHVHPRPYLQVTVLPCPRKSGCVRVSCCTFVLYEESHGEPHGLPAHLPEPDTLPAQMSVTNLTGWPVSLAMA